MLDKKQLANQIERAIKRFMERREGIFSFLKTQKKIRDLGQEISLLSSQHNWELNPEEIDSRVLTKNIDSLS